MAGRAPAEKGAAKAEGSIQEAAGTLASGSRRHGSPTGWEERRAAEEPLKHDPTPSTVYEAGTQVSTKPTPEEVRGWAQSFDKLMKSPAGRNVFREFLRTEYSEEYMLFWLACEELKNECNKHTIDEKARMIYEDYISILSPKEQHEKKGNSSRSLAGSYSERTSQRALASFGFRS
ncbi:PREDICTED: regulator of G-protein signaling 19-like [Pygoscelis adeliae]|uniref:regulator of G-protein signaling 19-like n=1 Tax=Pygoscelis adeliae TaxID=9238 RepID=UPI0004F50B25|nr:PREDICTED: regulator of G-protein signaling 19-like [Pygoscelis adeliae]